MFFALLPNKQHEVERVNEPAEVIKKWTHQKFQSWLSQYPTMSPWARYFLLLGFGQQPSFTGLQTNCVSIAYEFFKNVDSRASLLEILATRSGLWSEHLNLFEPSDSDAHPKWE